MTLRIRICTGARNGTAGAMDLMIARKLLLPMRHTGAGEFLSVALAAVFVSFYGMIMAVSFGGIRKRRTDPAHGCAILTACMQNRRGR